jgi:hypothetical protein
VAREVQEQSARHLANELASVKLGDARIERRARKMLADIAQDPGLSFPKVWQDSAELEAGYRFFANDNVSPTELVGAHPQETASRIKALKTPVIVAHDTTEIEFPVYFDDKRRSLLGEKTSRKQEFDVHVSFAVAMDKVGTPLGTLAAQPFIGKDQVQDQETADFWTERGGLFDNEMKRWRDGILSAEERLAGGEGEVIHTGDRELGRYNMLAWMADCGLSFVVRANLDQLRAAGNPRMDLPTALAKAPWTGTVKAMIARRSEKRSKKDIKTNPSRQARQVELSFRAQAVTLTRATHSDRDKAYNPMGPALPESFQINVVEVLERNPPEGEAPVHWVLTTTLPVATFEQQAQVVRVYRLRWTIEDFFRALKQGCKYESRQLESAPALLVALALFLPAAWYLLTLRVLVETAPDAPWRKFFAQAVITAIMRIKPRLRLSANATVQQVYLAIAHLGGHLKRNGAPGWQTLIHGWHDVAIAVKALGAKACFWVAINA